MFGSYCDWCFESTCCITTMHEASQNPKKPGPEENKLLARKLNCIRIIETACLSLRILPLCSCVPTSWIRRTFLASQTPSWCSTAVTRMEREFDLSQWARVLNCIFTQLLSGSWDEWNVQELLGLLAGTMSVNTVFGYEQIMCFEPMRIDLMFWRCSFPLIIWYWSLKRATGSDVLV